MLLSFLRCDMSTLGNVGLVFVQSRYNYLLSMLLNFLYKYLVWLKLNPDHAYWLTFTTLTVMNM